MPDGCFNSWPVGGCGWTVELLWGSMDWLSRADVILLAVMLANTGFILCSRLYRYGRASSQSGAFVRSVAAAMQDGNFNEVRRIAAQNRGSHVATEVMAGITAFVSAPPFFTDGEAVDAAQRAMRRSQNLIVAELKVGLGTLATIGSSAPFIGLLGTVYGILSSFRGIAMEKHTAMAMLASSLAESLLTTAMGLLVAVPTVWCLNHLRIRLDGFESEMSNAELEAITYLTAHGQLRNQSEPTELERKIPGFLTDVFRSRSWEVPYDRQRALLLGMSCCALCFTYFLGVSVYWHFAGPQF